MENFIIKKIGINGEGIGYLNRKPIFIMGALIEDEVTVTKTTNKGSYFIADEFKISKKSPHRIEPLCKIVDTCKGCPLMPLHMQQQHQTKIDHVKQSFIKYAHTDLSKLVFHPNSTPYAYRNQCKFVLGKLKDKVVSGLFALESNHLVAIDVCVVHDPQIETIRQSVHQILQQHQTEIYTSKSKSGLKHVVIRTLQNQATVTLTGTFETIDGDLVHNLSQIKDVVGIFYSKQADRKSHLVFGPSTIHLAGKPYLTFDFMNLKLQIAPASFFQLNTAVAQKLYQHAINFVQQDEVVVEAFSGIGVLSLLASKKAKKVIGIDINPQAIVDAQANAKLNNCTNVSFKKLDATKGLKDLVKQEKINTLMVDPPRTGLQPVFCQTLNDSKIKTIIYISCNPSTAAKDTALLQKSYRLVQIDAFDMFSHTPLVETVMVFKRR